MNDLFVVGIRPAGQDYLVSLRRYIARIIRRRNRPCLNILVENRPDVSIRQRQIAIAEEPHPEIGRIDERWQVSQLGQPGRDPLGVGNPLPAIPLADRPIRLPDGQQIAANGRTARRCRLSIFAPT